MKNHALASAALIVSVFLPAEVEAKKGVGSLFAAGKGAAALSGGVKSYDEDTLTVAALRACLEFEIDISEAEKKLEADSQPMKRVEARMATAEERLEDLDRYFAVNENVEFDTEAEVSEFNSEVERYNRTIDWYNEQLEEYQQLESEYNVKVDMFNEGIDKFDLQCAGKSYYEEDYASIIESVN